MNCSDARFALAADPRNGDPALLEHLERCSTCATYASDMHELDQRLLDALAVPVPEVELPSGPYPTTVAAAASGGGLARRETTRRFALAAGAAGVAILVGLLWAAFPQQSLASAVVAHMAHEPDAWSTTAVLSGAQVDEVMARSRLRLARGLPHITYANSCWFRGRHVPHFVVQTDDGPVTVLVLPEEPVAQPIHFDEGGYRGTLVPAPRGSIAVLARDGTDVEQVAKRVMDAIAYSGA
jgi:F0F1-type ATP synthase membrane subunit c/vacuolar-type H+-ATPase subunit K